MSTTQTTEKAEAHTAEVLRPMIGKYGKAVVVSSYDPDFPAWAVVRPFTGTKWFKTVEEAERVCEEHNRREIPRELLSKAEKGAQ